MFRVHYLWGVAPYWDLQDGTTDWVIWKDGSWHPAFPSSGGLAKVSTKDAAWDMSLSIAATGAAWRQSVGMGWTIYTSLINFFLFGGG